ncbi:putative DNA mismatch repair protein MSH2 [Trypanosoma conorhini]|uniref:Putative DNA mismatch repair protein MSH2 n=1 Tax=Trypanosoma conorhini TaxID=83891 RepID=A0A422NZS8_9TRYP|nr:putative DNA mismatch repair protein MSH2 [Trypanosoma conorhini]RNF11012.1 putative DNA mismatch repair protein MSH2 [Trypanosoma conorhini]
MLQAEVHPVEHVRIGKHVFPIYSHPLLRRKLKDEALLEQEIERRLHNPRLLHAVNEVVEQLLREGVTGGVSEDMVADHLEAVLGRLDNYFSDSEPAGTAPPPPNRPPPGDNRPDVLPAVRLPPPPPPPSFSVRRVFSSTSRDRATPSAQAPSTQQRGPQAAREPQRALTAERDAEEDADGELGPLALVGLSRRHLFPSHAARAEEACEVDPLPSFLPESSAASPRPRGGKGEQQKPKLHPPRQCSREAPPEWRSAVRSLFYSLLSLHLQESGGVRPEEMDLRGGAPGPLRLQGSELSALSPQAFRALDVTLDGNSSAIHCRRPPAPSILQRSHAQRAKMPMGAEPTALRRRVMATLAQSQPTTCVEKRRLPATGASLGHAWGGVEPSASLRPAGGSGQLDLPGDTTRSRVLASILENIDAQRRSARGTVNVQR